MAKRKPLGQVEMELLQAVERLQPVSVRALAEHLAETTGQARTTVLTMLERLRTKGYLSRKKIKNVNHYSTRVAMKDILPQLVADFVQRTLGGAVSPVVAYLQNKETLSREEIQELKALVNELESTDAQQGGGSEQ